MSCSVFSNLEVPLHLKHTVYQVFQIQYQFKEHNVSYFTYVWNVLAQKEYSTYAILLKYSENGNWHFHNINFWVFHTGSPQFIESSFQKPLFQEETLSYAQVIEFEFAR